MIRLENVSKVYGNETVALRDASFDVAKGDFVFLVGPSGSGKSTAMNIIGCLDRPSGGSFKFLGVEVNNLGQDQRALLRRNFIGFVFQGFNLLNRTTAIEIGRAHV